ncbi:MAG: AAA domain-containing protein [Promethearchaeota archaeon]
MGKFTKKCLTEYISHDCDRQLFLHLGESDPFWLDPVREPLPSKRIRRKSLIIQKLGQKYEQAVYSKLRHLPYCEFKLDRNKEITTLDLSIRRLCRIHTELTQERLPYKLIFEGQYQSSDQKQSEKIFSKGMIMEFSDHRPDILLFSNSLEFSNRELTSDNKIRIIPESELQTLIGINIYDIKNTSEENIGKKHFIEILYYMWTLAIFLEEHKLNDKFFVRVDGNGIFPQISLDFSAKTDFTVNEIPNLSMILHWEESYSIFSSTIRKIQDLWARCPIAIESIPLNLQPTCAYCDFIEDCKTTLGFKEGKSGRDWAVDLIPYTSQSIVSQLKSKGFQSVGEVADQILDLIPGNVPEPIYPEIPSLKIKADALKDYKLIPPRPHQVHSFFLPKFSPISLTFCIEHDPVNEKVFAAGLLLYMRSNLQVFEEWWQIWYKTILSYQKLQKKKENKKIALSNAYLTEVQDQLNEKLFFKITLQEVKLFWKQLRKFANYFHIMLPNTAENPYPQVAVKYIFSYINQGLSEEDELLLLTKLILRIHPLLYICNKVEQYCAEEDPRWPDSYFRPSTSIFYWSKQELTNFQEMMERNISKIIRRPNLAAKFGDLISWMTPSDSEVVHPYHHKKTFELQHFAEKVLGLPLIINYTWHEIAKILLNINFISRAYWISHFNYMVIYAWHDFLQAKFKAEEAKKQPEDSIGFVQFQDFEKKQRNREMKLRKQLDFKLNTIGQLRSKFQQYGRDLISRYSKPMRTSDYMHQTSILPTEFHGIAHVWYLFSKLSGAMDELEKEYYRTIYPEFGIGKLAVGKISNLKKIGLQNGKFQYTFNLEKLSSNMKIDVDDRYLLLADEMRDIQIGNFTRPLIIIIQNIAWDDAINGYEITTNQTKTDFLEQYKNIVKIPYAQSNWFLYPTSMDAWSAKLLALLHKHHLGVSWLGFRAAYCWEIRSIREIQIPSPEQFSAQEVYTYAPELLMVGTTSNQKFLSKIHPHPDDSQKIAILNALDNIMYGIQGPPGTGKSQTIAALIDESIVRNQMITRPIRILVTAFSYAAIRVIVKKVRNSKNTHGNFTPSALAQQIFIRSQTQLPIEGVVGLRDMDDLERKFNGTWRFNGQMRSCTKKKTLETHLEENSIIYANAHQLFHLVKDKRVLSDFSFDLIIVDEASQVPINYILSFFQFLRPFTFEVSIIDTLEKIDRPLQLNQPLTTQQIQNLTKVIIVGDYNQLPPVEAVDPPKNLKQVLDSLFSYYVRKLGIKNHQIEINYRSNEQIVNFTKRLGIYTRLRAHSSNADLKLSLAKLKEISVPWLQEILNPDKIGNILIHNRNFEVAISPIEARIVTEIITAYFLAIPITSQSEEVQFWKQKIGVVSPHNAHGRLIINTLFSKMTDKANRLSHLSDTELRGYLMNTIYSVEKFQGGDRDFIIGSMGVSDRDQLQAEEEFIYDLSRFNVLTSRAKCKILLIMSQNFLEFIPNNLDVMGFAAKVRKYAFDYCNQEKMLFLTNEFGALEPIRWRWHDPNQSITSINEIIPFPFNPVFSNISDQEFTLLKQDKSEYNAIFEQIQGYGRIENNHIVFQYSDLPQILPYLPIPQHFLETYKRRQTSNVKSSTGKTVMNKKPNHSQETKITKKSSKKSSTKLRRNRESLR